MYVIIVYDVNVKRVNHMKKFLRQYLNWVQNSVFEGELTKAELRKVKTRVKEIIDTDEDSVRVYTMRSKKFMTREELGESKVDISGII
ncbi:MAG: CRISPR-associated endonuclease Cas2 [Candidatus Thermoplasmatota archaeon]